MMSILKDSEGCGMASLLPRPKGKKIYPLRPMSKSLDSERALLKQAFIIYPKLL